MFKWRNTVDKTAVVINDPTKPPLSAPDTMDIAISIIKEQATTPPAPYDTPQVIITFPDSSMAQVEAADMSSLVTALGVQLRGRYGVDSFDAPDAPFQDGTITFTNIR